MRAFNSVVGGNRGLGHLHTLLSDSRCGATLTVVHPSHRRVECLDMHSPRSSCGPMDDLFGAGRPMHVHSLVSGAFKLLERERCLATMLGGRHRDAPGRMAVVAV